MTIFTLILALSFCALSTVSDEGAFSDLAGLNFLRSELQRRTAGKRFITTWHQKQLWTIGDLGGTGIAKFIDLEKLQDPVLVKELLPIIKEAFSAPERIARKEDRVPGVTLLLLKYLSQNANDLAIKQEISATMGWIKKQTASE